MFADRNFQQSVGHAIAVRQSSFDAVPLVRLSSSLISRYDCTRASDRNFKLATESYGKCVGARFDNEFRETWDFRWNRWSEDSERKASIGSQTSLGSRDAQGDSANSGEAACKSYRVLRAVSRALFQTPAGLQPRESSGKISSSAGGSLLPPRRPFHPLSSLRDT